MNIRLLTCIIIFKFSTVSSLFASDLRNLNYNISPTCVNSSNPLCYPFPYENADGTRNLFCTFVAGLNYFAPFLNLAILNFGHSLSRKWDKDIEKQIDIQLASIGEAEREIRQLLSAIIGSFENGIGGGGDPMIASLTVENLNILKCQSCINEFVETVSMQGAREVFSSCLF